jgi:hypothetical protein
MTDNLRDTGDDEEVRRAEDKVRRATEQLVGVRRKTDRAIVGVFLVEAEDEWGLTRRLFRRRPSWRWLTDFAQRWRGVQWEAHD